MGGIIYGNKLDVTDYNRLRVSVGWKPIAERQAGAGLAHSACIVAALDEGRPVGMARLITDGGYIAYIADVVVAPDHQGNGIASAMLARILRYIRSQMEDGERVMVCLTAAKGRESFYRQFAFSDCPNDFFGHGMSMWLERDTAPGLRE